MKLGRLLSTLAVVLAVLPGCSDDPPPSAATATAVHTPTSPPRTSTRTATSPPSATATVVPTSTRTALPSFTTTPVPPSPTATTADSPTPTATPVVFASGRCSEAVSCPASGFSTDRSQDSCCDLALSLSGLPFSWCPASAIDPQTGECSQCVAHPCQGLPTRTPTQTPTITLTPSVTSTPTVTATFSLLDLQVREVIAFAAASCPLPDATGPDLTTGCGRDLCDFRRTEICALESRGATGGGEVCGFACRYYSGHSGSAGLQRFASIEEASTAFEAVAKEYPRVDFHGMSASFWEGEFNQSGVPDGSSHWGVFRSGCWLATAGANDDTHFLLGPQPSETLELIYQRATEIELFANCDDAP